MREGHPFGSDNPMSGSMSAHAPGCSVGGAPAAEGNGVPILSSHHGHDLEHWPLHHTLVLGAVDSAVPAARAHLRQLLREWDQAQVEEDASVVISELVTNAVVASAELGPAVAPVLAWLGSDRHRVLLAVADASPQPPMRLPLGPFAYGGRGLALVEALCSRWGWCPASIAGLAKAVWAEWLLPDCRHAV